MSKGWLEIQIFWIISFLFFSFLNKNHTCVKCITWITEKCREPGAWCPQLGKPRFRNRRGQVKATRLWVEKPVTHPPWHLLPRFQDIKNTPFPNLGPLPLGVLRPRLSHIGWNLGWAHRGPLASAGGAATWLLRAGDEVSITDSPVKVIPRCPNQGCP